MTASFAFLKEFRTPRNIASEADAHDAFSAEQAYEKGVADGIARARAEVANETTVAIESMSAAFRDVAATRAAIRRQAEDEAGIAVAAVIRTICPQVAATGVAEAVRTLMTNELRNVSRPIVIKGASGLIESLTDKLAGVLDADTTLEVDDRYAPSRVTVEWFHGSASIDTGAIAARIADLANGISSEQTTDLKGET